MRHQSTFEKRTLQLDPLKSMYLDYKKKGFYLPPLNSPSDTTTCIFNVALEKCFRIFRTDVSQAFLFKKSSKLSI